MCADMRRPAAGNGRTFGIDQHRRTADNPKNSSVPLSTQDCRPFRSIGELTAATVADLVFHNRVRRLHARGPRVLAELLAELGAERAIMGAIEEKVDRYLAIRDADLKVTGGNRLPPLPVHLVQR